MSKLVMVRVMLQMTDGELALFLATWVKREVLQTALDISRADREWNESIVIKAGDPEPKFGP